MFRSTRGRPLQQDYYLSTTSPPALPQADGPRLEAFPQQKSPVEFVRILRASEFHAFNESDSTSGEPHAHVFEVSIASKKYALKIFHFYNPAGERFQLIEEENEKVSDGTIRAHEDPFNNECRAYARLIENQANGVLAIRCYGYLTISAEREAELQERFKINSWSRDPEDACQPISKRLSLRAIVKELVLDDPPLTEKLLGKMKRDLLKIRRMGVYVMDIFPRNYKGGLLVDFSIAMTTPHYIFALKKRKQVERLQMKDLWMFQRMVDESGVRTWLRSSRNNTYCAKLRSTTKRLEQSKRFC